MSREMAREMGLCHGTSGSWRVGDTMSSFSPTAGPGPSRPSPAGPATVDRLGPRAWLAPALEAAAGLPEPWPLPPARPPGRRPGHRERGGGRGSQGTDRRLSRLNPGAADPRPPLSLGRARSRPSLTPRVRRLLRLLLLRLPPLSRGYCSGSARRWRRQRPRKRRRPREQRQRRLQNAHARSTQAPPLRVSASEVSAPPSPRRAGVGLKQRRRRGWES